MGLFQIGARSTFINLSRSNSIFLIAPMPYDDDSEALVGQKSVKYILAPDILHHLAIKSWKEHFPDAIIIGPEGLRAKKASEGIHVDYEVSTANAVIRASDFGLQDQEVEEEFQFVYLPGHQNKELVTVHLPTKTMIEADLLFNLPAHEQYSKSSVSYKSGIFNRIFNHMHPGSKFHSFLVSTAYSSSK
ncbi:hypothetical protein V1511DRAFT_492788 [Dipodascopsis uninucleata]